MQTAHDPLCDLSYTLVLIHTQTHRTQSVWLRCIALRAFFLFHLLCLWLSLVHLYSRSAPPPLPLDAISPDNEGMIQLCLAHCSDQSTSVFLSDCVCIIWRERLHILLEQEGWCILLSVHCEIKKNRIT